MKLRKVMSSLAACALSVAMAAAPVLAEAANDKAVIDMNKKGSITIYKLLENDGHTNEGNGQPGGAGGRTGVPNILFTHVKIGTLENVAGTTTDKTLAGGAATDPAGTEYTVVGFYYNLTDEFKAFAGELGVNTADYDTPITIAGTEQANKYFSAEQVESILEAMKTAKVNATGADVAQTWDYNKNNYATGETAINGWVSANTGKFDYPVTDLEGKTSTGASETLDLGLYLVAETGYVDYVNGQAQSVYRSRTYDYTTGEMTTNNNEVEPTQNEQAAQGQQSSVTPADIAATYDHNYNDDYRPDDTSDAAQIGTENPVVIENPCSPFLVSVPMTNVADLGTDPAGTTWQYNVTVYPKNTMTTIYKRVVADDGDTLDQEQDYDIGQTIEQVIYADAPATMFNHHYEQYEITDTMSKGLSFQKIARVAYGPKVTTNTTEFKTTTASKLSDFNGFIDLAYGVDYNLFLNDSATATASNAKDANNQDIYWAVNGDDSIHSFTIKLTPLGLQKISDIQGVGAAADHVTGDKQVIVVFNTVLNKDAIIGAADGNHFNVNAPTLTWRHDNTATRKIEGNEVKVYTYELDLTKIGKDITKQLDNTSDNQQMRDSHNFDASEVAFAVKQNDMHDSTYAGTSKNWNAGKRDSEDVYLKFVKEADGEYHVWTPTDGTYSKVVKHDAQAVKGTNGVEYPAVNESPDPTLSGLAGRDIGTVYEIIQPKVSGVTTADSATAANENGMLKIKGLDSEVYTFTELTTSSSFNLLKSTFDITFRAPEPKDGNLKSNTGDIANYGATITTDGRETGLEHKAGIARLTVNNYKTITLHTGGTGMVAIYTAAVLALLAAAGTAMYIKRRRVA